MLSANPSAGSGVCMQRLRESSAGRARCLIFGFLLLAAGKLIAGGSIKPLFYDGFETPEGCDPDIGDPNSEARAFDLERRTTALQTSRR